MNRFALSASALVLALGSTLARAADETAHAAHETVGALPTVKQGLATGITALVVFAIVAAFLGAFVWPKINAALEARENKIRDEIESAERARQQAKEALEEYQNSLAQARAEAARMLEQARAQQQQLATELKAKADAELSQMRDRAMKDIDAAKRAAIAEVYADATNLSTILAAKILRREINPQDQQRLVEESLSQLEASRN